MCGVIIYDGDIERDTRVAESTDVTLLFYAMMAHNIPLISIYSRAGEREKE